MEQTYKEMCDDDEIWKHIKEYPEYMVSTHGRIKSLKCKKERILNPYLLKTGKREVDKYYAVSLMKGKKKTACTVHRLVALTFLENPNNLLTVDHVNSNQKLNNNINNLQWNTHSGQIINTDRIRNAKHIHYQQGRTKPYCVKIVRQRTSYNKSFEKEEEAQAYRNEILAMYNSP
jgi:hypothetical protein